jgi:hypothetical protein
MGTRNLTMVINKVGETKIAQYGQWDGYPSCVGLIVLNFLKDEKKKNSNLKNKLKKVRFLDEEKDKKFIESYNKNAPQLSNEPDNRTYKQKKWFESYISRDIGGDILFKIISSKDKEIVLINGEDSAKEGGWVEWSYVINLKDNIFSIYEHIDKEPLKIYSLNNLPTEEEFLKDLND